MNYPHTDLPSDDEPETWSNTSVAFMIAVFALIGFTAGVIVGGM